MTYEEILRNVYSPTIIVVNPTRVATEVPCVNEPCNIVYKKEIPNNTVKKSKLSTTLIELKEAIKEIINRWLTIEGWCKYKLETTYRINPNKYVEL